MSVIEEFTWNQHYNLEVLYDCRYIRYSNKEHQISASLPLMALRRTRSKETYKQSCQRQNKACCLSSFLNRDYNGKVFM